MNEKHALRVSLCKLGSDFSHFKIAPRFHYKDDGEPVYYGDTVILTSVQIPGYNLHASNIPLLPSDLPRDERDDDVLEVNLASQSNGWKVHFYETQAEKDNECLRRYP